MFHSYQRICKVKAMEREIQGGFKTGTEDRFEEGTEE